MFLAFQYPVEIPGVNNMYFLRAALNAARRHRGEQELDAGQFLRAVRTKLKLLEISEDLMQRAVNVGFSGGEKKRNEIFQMAMLEPKLAILDETDSGLDIDALRLVAKGVNELRAPDRAIVMITHYQRLLQYIEPDRVHVLQDGRIVESGDKTLAAELERRGYGAVDAAHERDANFLSSGAMLPSNSEPMNTGLRKPGTDRVRSGSCPAGNPGMTRGKGS